MISEHQLLRMRLEKYLSLQVVDAVALGFLAYSPEQIGISIPIYAAIRMGINGLQAYLRFKTTTPVGGKDA